MVNNYEISASLVIDNKDAKKALKEVESLIKKMNESSKILNDTQKKVIDSNEKVNSSQKKVNRAYKTGDGAIERLTSGLNEQNKANKSLINNIEKTHHLMVKQNATSKEYFKTMHKLAEENGLIFRNNTFVDSLKDIQLQMKETTIKTNNVSKAMEHFETVFKNTQKNLHEGNNQVYNFEKKIKETMGIINRKFGVTVKNKNGIYEFSDNIKDVENKINSLTKNLRKGKASIHNSNFNIMDLNNILKKRDALGETIIGIKEYNKILADADKHSMGFAQTEEKIFNKLMKLSEAGQLNEKHITKLNNAYKGFRSELGKYGNDIEMVINRTGNYNKLITQTTRSQRMQNYAMQVSAMRYSALGTMAGFVGGMFVQQLAVGFAEARIQAVKFEQQAQQFLKTSKLTTVETNRLNTAIEKYTKSHRKLNTQGLKNTVASVTKLNGLTEKQAEKAIPVIADITNMMVINGKTQEEAILAVNDALDGQFRRLQEIGVQGKEQLIDFGWTGKLNSDKDVMSLIDALDKIGKRKGWRAVTDDISTLDDAYNVLGNTIDDIVTPAITSVTPYIVDMIEVLGNLIGVLINMPLPIQGVVTVLGILGTAFGKMKLSMVWAKLESSELVARFMGLDDGMYNLTNSIGSVTSAVRDGKAGFQEGVEALMDYHQAEMNVSYTLEEYDRLRGQALYNIDLYSQKMKNCTDAEKEYFNTLKKDYQLQYDSLGLMRQKDIANTQRYLALKNLTNEESKLTQIIDDGNNKRQVQNWLSKNEFNNISRVTGLTKEQTHEFLVLTDMFDKTEGKYRSLNHSSSIFQETLEKLNLNNKSFNGSLKEEIIGLTNAEITANKLKQEFTELNNVQTYSNGLFSSWKQGIKDVGNSIATFFTTGIRNTITGLTSFNLKLIENIAGLFGFQVAEEVATGTTMALAASLGVLEIALGGIIAVPILIFIANLIQKQLVLNDSFKQFNDISVNGQSELNRLNDELSKLKKGTEDYNLVLERRNQLEKDYRGATSLNDESQQTYDKSKGRMAKAGQKLQKEYANQNVKINYSGLSASEKEIRKLNKIESEFSATTETRNKKLDDMMKKANLTAKARGKILEDYNQKQNDVIDATEKMKSPDMFERLGGYWDNFWARYGMNADEHNFLNLGSDSSNQNWENWSNSFNQGWTNLCNSFNQGWTNWSNSFNQGWTDLCNWFNQGWTNLCNLLNQGWTDLCNWFSQGWTNLCNWLSQTWENIKYWLNPLNWFTNDGGAGIIEWWNTNIADPLDGALKIFGIDLHIKGDEAGKNLEKGIRKGSKDASKPVKDEMGDINTNIKNQGGHDWFQTAKDAAHQIIEGIKKGLNRHSPGDGAKTILAEMEDAGIFMDEQSDVLYTKAVSVGQKIVDGMSNVQGLGQSLNVINNNNKIIDSTNEAQAYTSQQYGNMTNSVTESFGIMSDTANKNMNNVAMNNAIYLAQMNTNTQSNMTQIQTTTSNKLKTMESTTVIATNNMTKAWNVMRNNIINSASQIRNQSYSKFSSLQRSIAGFYRQIQSASFSSGLPAGRGRINSLSSKTIRKRQSSKGGYAGYDPKGFAGINDDYMKLLNKHNRTDKDIEDFYLKYPKALPSSLDAVAGGINPSTHVKKQYNYAKNWSIRDPTMYGVLLNMGYKVSDFNGKSPRISTVNDFEKIITQLFTAHPTHYEFYYDSKKSNAQAWASRGFNCYDGAELVMEIANDLGFNANMAYGTWNGIPHVSAVVGGRLFDTTQWQNRGVWRGASGVRFGGFAGGPDKGKRVKWSTAGRGKFAGPSNTTNNNRKNIVNVTISNNSFIGIDDYKKQMEDIAEDIFYDKMSVNPCLGI